MEQIIVKQSRVGERAQHLYEKQLRSSVENEENIGNILVLDVETGNYEIDADGLAAQHRLLEKHPESDPHSFFAIRIGYDAVFAVGGVITRTAS